MKTFVTEFQVLLILLWFYPFIFGPYSQGKETLDLRGRLTKKRRDIFPHASSRAPGWFLRAWLSAPVHLPESSLWCWDSARTFLPRQLALYYMCIGQGANERETGRLEERERSSVLPTVSVSVMPMIVFHPSRGR